MNAETQSNKWIEHTALIAVAAMLLIFLYELSMLARDLRLKVDQVAADLHGELTAATAATDNLRDAAAAARDASVIAKGAADAEAGYWQKTSVETYKTIASIRLTITRTDRTLNDSLGPALVAAVTSTSNGAASVTSDVHSTLLSLQPTLNNLASASAGAARAMDDPAITATLANVQETSAATAATAAQLEQTAEHIDGAAADVQAFVHRETTPARGTWNVIKGFLMEFAGPSAQVATAVK